MLQSNKNQNYSGCCNTAYQCPLSGLNGNSLHNKRPLKLFLVVV